MVQLRHKTFPLIDGEIQLFYVNQNNQYHRWLVPGVCTDFAWNEPVIKHAETEMSQC